jgi:hypothetical protein
MRDIGGRDGIRRISEVHPELGIVLATVFESVGEQLQERLSFSLAAYPFSDSVINGGRPLAPQGREFPSPLILTEQLPFGIILSNCLEVVEGVVGSTSIVGVPQAVLGKGEFIGLFELIDRIKKAKGPPKPDWTIYSGARSIRFLDFPSQKAKWEKLRNMYRNCLEPYSKRNTPYEEFFYIQQLTPVLEKCREWTAEILYFSPAWADLLEGQTVSENGGAVVKLLSLLTDTAWRSAARVRQSSNLIEEMLEAWGGDQSVSRCAAAHLLISVGREILTGRRPCFVPVIGDTDLGPFEIIRKDILAVADLRETLLGPQYLNGEEAGYIALHQFVPAAFNDNPLDGLRAVCGIIANTKKKVRQNALNHQTDSGSVPALEVEDIFSRATFRVRTGRELTSGFHPTVHTFCVDFSESDRTGKYKLLAQQLECFYAPFFTDPEEFPNPGSEFFRVCIRLQR